MSIRSFLAPIFRPALRPVWRHLSALRWSRRQRPIARIRHKIRAMAEARTRGDMTRATRLSHDLQAHGLYLSPKADLAANVKFPHPTSIVIGEGCVVEEDVILYQSVTLGAARRGDWQAGNYPTIGAGTTIFAGAVIIGAVRVGRGCTIGANAVVLGDIPDGATAVGVPARVISRAKPQAGISSDIAPDAANNPVDWSRSAARLVSRAMNDSPPARAKRSGLED